MLALALSGPVLMTDVARLIGVLALLVGPFFPFTFVVIVFLVICYGVISRTLRVSATFRDQRIRKSKGTHTVV